MKPISMRRQSLPLIVAACVAAASASSNLAAEVEHDLSLAASAGIQYDSNITVSQIDAETNEGDYAALADAEATWDIDFSRSDSLSLSYIFSHQQQFELDAFDLQLHGSSASFDRKFDLLTAGVAHQFFYSSLGGDGLLRLHRGGPFVSAFPTRWLFLRGAYTFKNKDLIDRTDRDAQTHMGETSALFFLDGTDTFLSFGYRFEYEDATAARFDFQAQILKAGVDTRLPFGGAKNRFEIDIAYEARDYDSVTPSIGTVRDDERLTLDVSWEVPLGKYLYVDAQYRYRDFSSNLPAANFTESVAGASIGFEY